MAFDKPTRNRLAKFVSDARSVIADEFTEQFQSLYGISAKGEIAPLEKLGHLDEAGLATAALLRERIDYLEKTHPDDKEGTKAAVARLAREQAFTILNRLAAIRMAEKRGLIVESVGQGYQSRGFKVFETVAGSALGDTYHRYRRYLFCLFDELAIDLGVLFDRGSPQALLFPREPALLALLDFLHAADLEPLWAEDETIGWIYQYYNDPEERKKMRKESAAPRNSRELAVRNQFFTPRYVVEFLTDNTLGRIWYEMTCGQTRLAQQCRYLVRRPDEVFFAEADSDQVTAAQQWLQTGEGNRPEIWDLAHTVNGYLRAGDAGEGSNHWVEERLPRLKPDCIHSFSTQELLDLLFLFCRKERSSEGTLDSLRHETDVIVAALDDRARESNRSDLSQADLLRQPVFIPHRPLKDPREIRLLDPACGSMHFGLYAFDLFETIYEEAWDNGTCPALQEAYASRDEFLQDVPRLIIEHNIHGIDIDPRAVQIAGFSLWLRAQKAWQSRGVTPAIRPRVRRSNIVCAEPMPGSPEMLEAFVATLDPRLLGELVKTVFDKMQLAGEAGTLLKIEEEIRTAIDTARKEWIKQQDDLLTRKDGSQEEFFDTAEQQVIDALRTYAEQADADSYQRRLFADDAARGFAFIDLCRKRYDAVVMNPPFGAYPNSCRGLIESLYPRGKSDVFAAFFERALGQMETCGRVGQISSRAALFLSSLEDWRNSCFLGQRRLSVLADLGHGVLDDALVEAAAYVSTSNELPIDSFNAYSSLAESDKGKALGAAIENGSIAHIVLHESLTKLPQSPIVYWLQPAFIDHVFDQPRLDETVATARVGLQTDDDFRFLRLFWEVQVDSGQAAWPPIGKGGEYAPFYDDIHLVVNWRNDAEEMRAFIEQRYSWTKNARSVSKYGTPGLTYPERTTSDFSARPLPAGSVFSIAGPAILPIDISDAPAILALSYTRLWRVILEIFIGAGDAVHSGSAARHYKAGILNAAPFPSLASNDGRRLRELGMQGAELGMSIWQTNETSRIYKLPVLKTADGVSGWAHSNQNSEDVRLADLESVTFESDQIAARLYGLEGIADSIDVDGEYGPHSASFARVPQAEEVAECFALSLDDLVDRVAREQGYRRQTTKCSFFSDRRYESAALLLRCSVATFGKVRQGHAILPPDALDEHGRVLLSMCVGMILGRWDIRCATGQRQPPELPDPFDSLPVCPPGMLQKAEGLPAEAKDVPADYPLRISWPGILVDDENHPEDIVARVREAIEVIWPGSAGSGSRAEAIEQEACGILGVKTLRDYFRRPTSFFADHLKRYSKSRRQAPIYWPLSTKTGSYTLWLYYHRLTDQTLHTCLADFLDPKLRKVQSELDALTAPGGGGTRAGELREFLDELHDLRDEIERVIKLPWKPNLNDGVLITASPLHKLFRLPKWQKDLKACWDKLAKGDFDWAHLAYTIWPQRVEKACEKDRSIAIAHGLEHLCKADPPKAKAKRSRKKAEVEDAEELAGEAEEDGSDQTSLALDDVQPEAADDPAGTEDRQRPAPIAPTDRTEVLGLVRRLFSSGGGRERETAIRELATLLGYQRVGSRVREVLNNDLTTAVRRGILENHDGLLSLATTDLRDYERGSLKDDFLSAIGRTWIERDEAIRLFARWLGYTRTGSVIEETARSLINGLLREGRLEKEGTRIRRS